MCKTRASITKSGSIISGEPTSRWILSSVHRCVDQASDANTNSRHRSRMLGGGAKLFIERAVRMPAHTKLVFETSWVLHHHHYDTNHGREVQPNSLAALTHLLNFSALAPHRRFGDLAEDVTKVLWNSSLCMSNGSQCNSSLQQRRDSPLPSS
eukprot:gnl/TRDRNA2_/TRDRNA2_203484_c0_seq1.p1 gnl/TRDRNA2_/TRDRNA2_203484_c0~~gnl/TRDRNA2_/TRDRNA2_203484_c0_seq1.p1  ORF type:complete len:153 (-),score=4.21 gnl/TRDRNA2_/TRDRNA2_203484_c0_seq1:216-674(-)